MEALLVIFGVIGYLIANFQSKNPPNQSPNNNDNIEQTKSSALTYFHNCKTKQLIIFYMLNIKNSKWN
jgi:hypothetical protein